MKKISKVLKGKDAKVQEMPPVDKARLYNNTINTTYEPSLPPYSYTYRPNPAVELEGQRRTGDFDHSQYPFSPDGQQHWREEQDRARQQRIDEQRRQRQAEDAKYLENQRQQRYDQEQAARRVAEERARVAEEARRTAEEQHQREEQARLEQEKQRKIEQEAAALKLQRAAEERTRRETEMCEQRAQRAKEERIRIRREENVSKDNVRRLRELIREKYALDIWIWERKGVQKSDRDIVQAKCQRADLILRDIQSIINDWQEDQFSEDEWYVAKRIKDGLSKSLAKQALWADMPPWDPRRKEPVNQHGESA